MNELSNFELYYFGFVGVIAIIQIIAMWKLFTKAGESGVKALIPFYNAYIFCKIAYGKGWLFLFMLIPIVNIIFGIIFNLKLSKVFGKGTGFGIGLIFLPMIFLSILAFGEAEYLGYDVE